MSPAVNHLYRPGDAVLRRRGYRRLFGSAGLAGRDAATTTRLFLGGRRIIIGDHRRYTQRRRQTISIEAAFVATAWRGISGNRRAARPTPTRTIGFSLDRCGRWLINLRCRLGDDIGLIAARLTLGAIITRIAIAGIGIARAVIAPGIALPRTSIAVLIAILIPAIGAVAPITVAVLAVAVFTITALTTNGVAIARFPIAVTIAITVAVTIAAIPTIITAIGLIRIDPVIGHAVAIAVEILVIAIVELVVRVAAWLAFFKAGAGFGEYAEIMISKLQIIFGVDAITLHLGIARQRLVFFKQLRRITARAIVDAIATFGPAPRIATTL